MRKQNLCAISGLVLSPLLIRSNGKFCTLFDWEFPVAAEGILGIGYIALHILNCGTRW
jgi:hypothetical protein